jgi:hypothetical protein
MLYTIIIIIARKVQQSTSDHTVPRMKPRA